MKVIAIASVTLLSYLLTENDNQTLVSNNHVFDWLVAALDCAISLREGPWSGLHLETIDFVKVRQNINYVVYFWLTIYFILLCISIG